MNPLPKKGEVYKHFKGNLYEILAVAKHTETMENMVVYQEVDGEAVYVRPLEMFVSKVDKEKYPEVFQTFSDTAVFPSRTSRSPDSRILSGLHNQHPQLKILYLNHLTV